MNEQNNVTKAETSASVVEEGKTMAIISYITWIGTVVAFIMNNDKKNEFTKFHIRQMIGLSILSIVNTVIGRISGTAAMIISVILLVLWVIGFIGVLKGEKKEIPVIGAYFQDWFKNI